MADLASYPRSQETDVKVFTWPWRSWGIFLNGNGNSHEKPFYPQDCAGLGCHDYHCGKSKRWQKILRQLKRLMKRYGRLKQDYIGGEGARWNTLLSGEIQVSLFTQTVKRQCWIPDAHSLHLTHMTIHSPLDQYHRWGRYWMTHRWNPDAGTAVIKYSWLLILKVTL